MQPLRASNWNKVNSISCVRSINREVICQHKQSAFLGLGSENSEFKLLAVNIRKSEGGSEYPDEYRLDFKTDSQVIEVNDYIGDRDRAYRSKELFTMLLRGDGASTVTLYYGDGFTKTSIIWIAASFTIIISILLLGRLDSSLIENPENRHYKFSRNNNLNLGWT
ncbi:hypothetical protein HC931_04140 [Candidatus Gracilibacteria bacterium]|nr:hypothetical protein [Candidatus Gracilibacteria bacterium]